MDLTYNIYIGNFKLLITKPKKMAKVKKPVPNGPSKTGNKSGKGRGNLPPKPKGPRSN